MADPRKPTHQQPTRANKTEKKEQTITKIHYQPWVAQRTLQLRDFHTWKNEIPLPNFNKIR